MHLIFIGPVATTTDLYVMHLPSLLAQPFVSFVTHFVDFCNRLLSMPLVSFLLGRPHLDDLLRHLL